MSNYSTNASVNLEVNGQQAKETLKDLKSTAEALQKQLREAQRIGDAKQIKNLQKQIKDVNREIKTMESSVEEADRVLRRLDKASPKDLQRALSTYNRQLKTMERGSKEWDVQVSKIKRVKAELSRVNKELTVSQSLTGRVADGFNRFSSVFMATAASLAGVVVSAKESVNKFAEMDQEMANVRKYTGMTAEEVEVLNEEFKKMDTRSSREELNKLAQEAGRLGKTSQEDVLGFVKAADVINVALDDLGEGATLTLSKITSIFGEEERLGTEKSLLAVGSIINELSQNSTASAPYLAQFAQRLAGVGVQANLTVPQIMAFGAVLDAQGQQVEMSATAMSQLIMKLFKNTEKIAQATGLDLKEFSNTLKRDTNEGLMMLLQRLHDLGGIDVLAPVFKDMGENGARASSVISALAANINTVRWQQEEANKAYQEGTSVLKEFEVQNTTVQAGLEKRKKALQERIIQLGQELLPLMKYAISSTSAIVKVLLTLTKFVKENGTAIAILASGIAAYTIAVNAATIATKLHNAIVTIATSVQKAWNLALKANPIGLVASAVAMLVVGIIALVRKQKEGVAVTKELTATQKALSEIDKQAGEEFTKEAAKVRALSAALHNDKLAIDQRKEALQQLRSIVPDYHAELTTEGKLINDNVDAINKYVESLKESIRLKANEDKLQTILSRQIELEEQVNIDDDGSIEKKLARLQKENQDLVEALSMEADAGNYAAARDIHTLNRINSIANEIQIVSKALEEYNELSKEAERLGAKVAVSEQTPLGINANDRDGNSSAKNKFQAEDDWREREEALNRISYATGQVNYKQYTRRMLEIQEQYHKKKLKHTDLAGNEDVTIQADYLEAKKKLEEYDNKEMLRISAEEENKLYKGIQAGIQQRYIDGLISKETYDLEMEQAEINHLRKMRDIHEVGTKEYIAADNAYTQALTQNQIKQRENFQRTQEKYLEIYKQMQEKYFGNIKISDQAGYDEAVRNLEVVHAQMLAATEGNAREQMKVERAFQEAKYQLGKQYNVDNARELGMSYRSAIEGAAEWLKSDGGQALTGALDTLLSSMSAIFSEVSNLIQAEADINTAAVESSYDSQISAAEGNKAKVNKLEEQKQAEIAKIKQEANRKMFAMQVIQAIAQTAMSALSAYSSAAAIPVVGWIMAPIAAAMAVAAGGIQIAAIKKQQQASEAQGYASGGYTPKGLKYQEVGVVHAGEWVASQELLANPQASAMIQTLDHAQRTNTIGSLQSADVSRSITAPAVIAEANTSGTLERNLQVTAGTLAGYTETMRRLNDRLNEPFVTVNTVTGDHGTLQAQQKYDQLMRNKSKKKKG